MSALKDAQRVVGIKQLVKAVEAGRIAKVYVADDADAFVTRRLLELCQQASIPVEHANTMQELGAACSIDVGAAAAGTLKS